MTDSNTNTNGGSNARIYVGNLRWEVTLEDLNKAFDPFGQIVDSVIITDKETGKSRGYAFITYTDRSDMHGAIAGMNGKDLYGRVAVVREATPKQPRDARSGPSAPVRGYSRPAPVREDVQEDYSPSRRKLGRYKDEMPGNY